MLLSMENEVNLQDPFLMKAPDYDAAFLKSFSYVQRPFPYYLLRSATVKQLLAGICLVFYFQVPTITYLTCLWQRLRTWSDVRVSWNGLVV